MRWLVADSLYCSEAFFCSHLDSYSHYLREFGEESNALEIRGIDRMGWQFWKSAAAGPPDILLALDSYDLIALWAATKRIAQVAAICNPMPWDVRKPDGSPAYDLIISSIPWMVAEARAKGCRAEYQALAFDTRARVCGMGVERDLGCVFVGTVGPNHVKRAKALEELKDVVTVLPQVFGREYFKTLARARAVLNIHAEWARGAANNMRMFEACGMGAGLVGDGWSSDVTLGWDDADPRQAIQRATENRADVDEDTADVLLHHTYEQRIPQLVEWARSL